jgi:hypothetical protein
VHCQKGDHRDEKQHQKSIRKGTEKVFHKTIITEEKKGVKRGFVTLSLTQGLADQVHNDEKAKRKN